MVDNGQKWSMNNGGQYTILNNGQWWSMDNYEQLTKVDDGQWWTIDIVGQWWTMDNGQCTMVVRQPHTAVVKEVFKRRHQESQAPHRSSSRA